MDITSRNFVESFPLIKKSVETADFVSFDFEFSGLFTCNEDRTNDYDSDETRYQKLRHIVSRMNAFQIGICTFKWDEKEKHYVNRPFNVFLFPHSDTHLDINDEAKVLSFMPSCVRFNIKNDFNFNKLFRMGVNFRRLRTEKEAVRKMCVDKITAFYANNQRWAPLPAHMRHKNCLCADD